MKMKEFDNFYRRHPELNTTGVGFEEWMKAKERDERIWQAALKTLKEECHCAGMYGEKGSCELVDWINKELEEN